MTRPIIDAGPSLNFFSLNEERLLFRTVGPLSTPESVIGELQNRSRKDQRFRQTPGVLRKLPESLWKIISDENTPQLLSVLNRIAASPYAPSTNKGNNIGEIMVVSHAVVLAEAGLDTYVLIDDQGGQKLARHEGSRLARLALSSQSVGSLTCISTIDVLTRACDQGFIESRQAAKALYARMKPLDDGLPPIELTGLLTLPIWET